MRKSVAVVLLALLSSCQAPTAEMTTAERQAIAQEVLQAAHEGFAAGAANDFEAMMASLPADPAAFFVGEPAMYLNRLVHLPRPMETQSGRIGNLPEKRRSGTNLMPVQEHVAVLSRDAAVYVYKGDWEVLDLEGNVASQGPIAATTVFVKENGVWKQLHYHQSWESTAEEGSTGG